MLCVFCGGDDAVHIACDLDGGSGSQICVNSMAGLIHKAVLQLVSGLAHHKLSQSRSLLVPLVLGTGISLHAVVLAQFILGQDLSRQIGSNRAGSIKGDGSADGIDGAGSDDTALVHSDGNQGHIVSSLAVFLGGGSLALGNTGHNGQTGLDGFCANSLRTGGSLCDQCLEVTDFNRDRSSQVSLSRSSGFGNCDAGNLRSGLAGDVGSKGSSLGIPLSNGAAPGHHAVAFAQLILGLNGCGGVGGQCAGGVKTNLGLDCVDDTGGDDTVLDSQCGNSGIQLSIAGSFRSGSGGLAHRTGGSQTQLIASLGTQMLCVFGSGDNAVHIAADVDGGSGSQVSVSGMAGLVHSAGLQFFGSLANRVLGHGSSLLVPLVLGTAISLHAIILAQLILAEDLSSQVGSNSAGGIKGHAGAHSIDGTGLDDAIVIHSHSHQSHIVLRLTVFLCGSGLAFGNTGNYGQTGLHGAFADNGGLRCLGGSFGCGRGFFMAAGGAGTVGVIHHRRTGTACQQTDHQGQCQDHM